MKLSEGLVGMPFCHRSIPRSCIPSASMSSSARLVPLKSLDRSWFTVLLFKAKNAASQLVRRVNVQVNHQTTAKLQVQKSIEVQLQPHFDNCHVAPVVSQKNIATSEVTINCPERGLLLLRVRDEIRMSIAAYQTLYQSSFLAAKTSHFLGGQLFEVKIRYFKSAEFHLLSNSFFNFRVLKFLHFLWASACQLKKLMQRDVHQTCHVPCVPLDIFSFGVLRGVTFGTRKQLQSEQGKADTWPILFLRFCHLGGTIPKTNCDIFNLWGGHESNWESIQWET